MYSVLNSIPFQMGRVLIFCCIHKTKLTWHIFSDLTWNSLKPEWNLSGYVMGTYYIVFVTILYRGKFRRGKFLSHSQNFVTFFRRKVLLATTTVQCCKCAILRPLCKLKASFKLKKIFNIAMHLLLALQLDVHLKIWALN